MCIAEEQDHYFAAKVRQRTVYPVVVGKFELMPEVRSGDVGGLEIASLAWAASADSRTVARNANQPRAVVFIDA